MELERKPTYQFFTKALLKWAAKQERPMPWKGEKDPYRIWLSEIILQQTRVEQGLPYYQNFCSNYPSIHDLAKASEDELMKLWEGLGYYSRARNLHFTAKYISKELNGVFPDTYEEILKLKGVGPYTAAAIASFAYNLPYAVVDGNVYRVLARYFGIKKPIDSTEGKKYFKIISEDLLDKKQAGIYNQAIMDFGATCCTPKKPQCNTCPMKKHCVAFAEASQDTLPLKSKRIKKLTRHFNYLVLDDGKHYLIQKRLQKDIWQNLYEFPLYESADITNEEAIKESQVWQDCVGGNPAILKGVSKPFRQTLSHRYIIARFWKVEIKSFKHIINTHYIKVDKENIHKFAFPKVIDWYFNDNSLYLELL